MGKGKDHAKKGKGGGREKKYREESEEEEEEEEPKKVGKQSATAGMMPPSDDSEEEEEPPPRKGGGQNKNAGKMPSDDDDDSEDDDSDDDPPPTSKEMAEFIKSKGLGKEFLSWLAKKRKEKAAKPLPGYEMSRMEIKKKQEEDEEEAEEVDPNVAKRLEEVRKRREAQAKARIAADGWDRMKPMSADNHPPGTVWPPPGGAADVS